MILKKFISTMETSNQSSITLKIIEENNIGLYDGIAINILTNEEYIWLQDKQILYWHIVDEKTIEICI